MIKLVIESFFPIITFTFIFLNKLLKPEL